MRQTIAAHGMTEIGDSEWNALTAAVPGLSTADMKHAGIPVKPPWTGVAQQTFDDLEASLSALATVYAIRTDLRRFCRVEVIRAKDRARFASRHARLPAARRAAKAEMVEWMLVWLGDPAMFSSWARLRRSQLDPNLLAPAGMDVVMEDDRVKCNVCHGTGQCTACKGTSNGGQCFNCAGTGHCPQCQGTGKRKAENVK